MSKSMEGKSAVTTKLSTQELGTSGRTRRAVLASLALGAVLAASVALAGGTARQAEAAASNEKMLFVSDRTTGKGVNNPTGDYEIFSMNPNGTAVRQLTFNEVFDSRPLLSPDGTKVLYQSQGAQPSNPEGDQEIYVMNASDGSSQKNLTDNRASLDDRHSQFSPDGRKIAYTSEGEQPSNPEADPDVYEMNASDGSGKTNLSNNGFDVYEESPSFSPDGQKIAYTSFGAQASNPEGDMEIYVVNADGTGQKNLTNNGAAAQDHIPYYSPDGQKIAYTSDGAQASNPEGDQEVYVMNADGSGQKNLTNNGQNGSDVYDFAYYAEFSPDGQKITYGTGGVQASNPEGDYEIYVMNASDGSGKINLTNNASGVSELFSDYSPDGQKIVYTSDGVQASNPEGESELYVMSAQDGSGKKNITNNGVRDFYAEWGR